MKATFYKDSPHIVNECKKIGESCKYFRKNCLLKITQKQIAEELKISKTLVCLFENGKLNNAYILSWYVKRGLVL